MFSEYLKPEKNLFYCLAFDLIYFIHFYKIFFECSIYNFDHFDL